MEGLENAQLQLDYYKHTAGDYDHWHLQNSSHNIALKIISAFIAELEIQSVLDVACGTGRGWYLKHKHPHLQIRGTDVATALITQAVRNGILLGQIDVASAFQLPYPDNSFDLVTEFGSLHHVAEPDKFISEMLRVARVGIAISDSNMYSTGLGPFAIFKDNSWGAILKLLLYRSGILTRLKKLIYGRDYSVSEGDGLFYTYSLFEGLPLLQRHCSQVFLIPLLGSKQKNTLPLLAASHCLMMGFKNKALSDSLDGVQLR